MSEQSAPSLTKPIVEVKNLSFSYKKKNPILENVNFSIMPGEIIGIAGKSGEGKTTIGYILKGLIPHTFKGNLAGEVEVAGCKVRHTKISRLAKIVGMVFQNLNSQLFNTTVKEEIEFGIRNLKLDLNWAQDAMDFLQITDLESRMPMNLSAGQKQRVVLASIIAMHPQVLILDEPTAHLDNYSKIALKNWLLTLNQEFDMTILIIEQDPWILGEICQKLLYVQDKKAKMQSKEQFLEKTSGWSWKLSQ